MSNNTWSRPHNIPFPNVWQKFTKTYNGNPTDFEIQDVTENLIPACLEFMDKYFFPDEPLYAILDFCSDSLSVEEQRTWWKKILHEKMSIVCLTNEGTIAGINILYYHHKSHDNDECQLKGKQIILLNKIVQYLENQINRYDMFQVEDYIDEFGLCVHPNFRGLGIATELLKARYAIGKSLKIKATFTVFTAIASQKAADKAGFKNLLEISYAELSEVFPSYKFNVKDTKTIRYMYLLCVD